MSELHDKALGLFRRVDNWQWKADEVPLNETESLIQDLMAAFRIALDENFGLAAGQCAEATADDVGTPYCKRIRDLLAENERLLADWMAEQSARTTAEHKLENAEAKLRALCDQEPVAWMTDHKFVCDNGITKRPGDASAWKLEGWRVQSLIPRPTMEETK